MDRGKVIKAWECCNPFNRKCNECPYEKDCYHDDISRHMVADAIALLKEQEAELLTFEEVKNHFHVPIKLLGDIEKYVDFENDIEPLYLECDIEDAWIVHWRTYDNTKEHLEKWGKDYGKTWRCWTKKPTEEQKRSVKWE